MVQHIVDVLNGPATRCHLPLNLRGKIARQAPLLQLYAFLVGRVDSRLGYDATRRPGKAILHCDAATARRSVPATISKKTAGRMIPARGDFVAFGFELRQPVDDGQAGPAVAVPVGVAIAVPIGMAVAV